jgi:glycosyltransferase involved in cell wall biosynthesis
VNHVPRLSVGLPVYNGERYLAESVEALLGQTFEDFELLISDNASTDATGDICREYAKADSRVRYIRQPRNIGAAPNHNFLFGQSRGEYFKWAAADDLYARDLLERCVDVLDKRPEVILAHSWTAAIDGDGLVIQAMEYPLATDSPNPAERMRAMLFGDGKNDFGLIRADDQYGVMRAEVLRRVPAQGSYYHSDRTQMTEIALHGPFCQVPEWLYFRRDHSGRPQHAVPTVRGWCANLDPRRANRFRNPTVRLVAEFVFGYAAGIARAPLSLRERRECYLVLAQWLASKTAPALRRVTGDGMFAGERVEVPAPPAYLSVEAVVAGRERNRS